MNDEKLCDLFHKEYRAGFSEIGDFYKQYQFGVTGIVLLLGGCSFMTRKDLLELVWSRIDVFLHLGFAALCILLMVTSGVCLAASIIPRRYSRLDDLSAWNSWRAGYRKELEISDFGKQHPTEIDGQVAKVTCEQLLVKLSQATDGNTRSNDSKHRWWIRSLYALLGGIVALGVESAMAAVLFLGHVKGPTP